MTRLRRTASAWECIALALALCVVALTSHWRAGAFQAGIGVAPRPLRRVAATAARLPRGAVDVNTADATTLCRLDGVGPKTAQAILDERETRGRFDYPQDLLMVKGIGVKKLATFYAQLNFSR